MLESEVKRVGGISDVDEIVKEEGVVMDSGSSTCLVSSQLLPGLLDKDTLVHCTDATQGVWLGSQLQSVLFTRDGCTGRKLQ